MTEVNIMALEIGFQTFPNSANRLTKSERTREAEQPVQPQEKAQAFLENVPEIQEENKEIRVTDLRDTVSHLNDSVQELRRELKFSVDEESGRVVVKVINAKDGETIRQIPAEEILQLARRFTESEAEGRLLKVIA